MSFWKNKRKAEVEKMRKEYHKYCIKSKSSNYVFCPKKILKKKKDKKLKWLNDHFKKISTKKRKTKKKRGRKTRRKRKRKTKKRKQKKKKNDY